MRQKFLKYSVLLLHRDEIRRKMLNERRKAMKNQQTAQDATSTDPDVQIFIPDAASSQK